MHRIKSRWFLLLVLTLYTIFYLVQVRGQSAVTNVDYWHYLRGAEGLSANRIETWVHSFHSVGYLALLRPALVLGLDVVRYGQLLSWSGSIAFLVAVYILLRKTTDQAGLGTAGIVLLILHPFFRFQAMQEGPDMLAAGLQLSSLAVVLVSAHAERRRRLLFVAAAGALLGGAYLVRYTSLTLVPLAIVYLWLQERKVKPVAIVAPSLFVGAFGLVALPQLFASTVVRGAPFYNEMARNVWFGIYGAFNWTENWQRIPPGITLIEIVRSDPGRFLNHWVQEFQRFFTYDANSYAAAPLALERKVTLWEPLVIHLGWIAGSLLLFFDRRIGRSELVLLFGGLFIPVMVASMAWLFTRFLLVPMAFQVIVVVLGTSQVSKRLANSERGTIRVTIVLFFVFMFLFLSGTTWQVKRERTLEAAERVQEIQPVLEAAGVGETQALLTNNRLIQDLRDPRHPQYPLFEQPGDEREPLPAFLARIIGQRQPRYLLFDWTSHAVRTYSVKPYRSALAQAKDLLVPLNLLDEYALYCIVPCGAEEVTPIDAHVSPNVTLIGTRAFSSHGFQHGLYLYWQLNGAVNHSQPVSLTLRNEAGEEIFQSAGSPQQGTYPIDLWPVGQTVVDYYPISSAKIVPDRDYYLTVNLGDQSSAGRQARHKAVTVPVRFSYP